MQGREMRIFAEKYWSLGRTKLDEVIGAAQLFCCSKRKVEHGQECKEKWVKMQYQHYLPGR
jgi:hypothetical protein